MPMTNQLCSQQAAFLCRADSFQRWIERRQHRLYDSVGTSQAAEWLRNELGVISRAELDVPGAARERFDAIVSEYRQSLAEQGIAQ